MATGNTEATPLRQFALPLLPLGTLNSFLDAFGQAVALHAQAVDCDAWRLQQIALTDLRRVHADLCGQLVELRFEREADVDGTVAPHGAACGLVGQDTVTVVLNVRNIVECAQEGAGIKNGNHAVGAVGPSILYHARFDGGDAAVFLNASFQIDDGARAPAMRPEHFLARVGDFDWSLRLARRDRRDDLQRDDFALTAETAADQGLDHANLRHRHFKNE